MMYSISHYTNLIFIAVFILCVNRILGQAEVPSNQTCATFWGFSIDDKKVDECMNLGGVWYKCLKTRGNPAVHGRGCRQYVDGDPAKDVDPTSQHREVQCAVYWTNYVENFMVCIEFKSKEAFKCGLPREDKPGERLKRVQGCLSIQGHAGPFETIKRYYHMP